MQSPLLVCFLVAVTILLGVLSSMYPALAISAFKPAKALKGEFNSGSSGVFLRKLLVGAQFTITLILVTGIVVITSQMSFINHKSLAFEYNQQMAIESMRLVRGSY